uniref:Outer membrane cytochrome MtrC/MtrF-like domain-containing protein n=1 Tax=Solibacter usitatus (strain Ellin6076) TaxID=234267 RepID=Q01WI6_SOLUE
MRILKLNRESAPRWRGALALTFVGAASLFCSSERPGFTPHDKAYHAAESLVNFVRPGLVIKISRGSLAADGAMQVQFSVTDPKGLPLDLNGVTTPGTIATSYVAAYIPAGQIEYISLIARPATGAAGTANQPAADRGGTLVKTADGQYTYTYSAKAPATFDRRQTVTFGTYASRDLTEFDLGTNASNDVFSFVPTGAPVVDVHDEIYTDTCNKCHDPLAAHGGSRRQVPLCVMCHNPGGGGTDTVDPDTGNSIDFRVMIHKIHMGSSLPSVQAGIPYRIIGFGGAINDWSTVVFPALGPQNCQMCHENGAPPQGGVWPPGAKAPNNPPPVNGTYWLTHPSRAACGPCHDDVNFATGKNHANLPQVTDNLCSTCHIPQGDLPFDLSILGAHVFPQYAPGVPGVVFTLQKIDNGLAGETPTVTFTLKNNAGTPINPGDMNLLNLVLGGPTADYQQTISEDARKAAGGNGTYAYKFTAPVPAKATGTWTVAIEGYKNITLLPGTVTETVVRDAGHNVILNFATDASPVTPHLVEFDNAHCNACHYSLSAHGTIRNEGQYCILCHNPTATDQAQRPAGQLPAQAIDMPVMVHRIHTGEDAIAGGQLTPYIVYGRGASVNDFSDVRYPGDRRNCDTCHTNGSQQVPVPATRIQVTNPRAFVTPMGPTAAACTACHTDKSAVAHTQLNTSPAFGESCDVCHGTTSTFSVDKVHARAL